MSYPAEIRTPALPYRSLVAGPANCLLLVSFVKRRNITLVTSPVAWMANTLNIAYGNVTGKLPLYTDTIIILPCVDVLLVY